MVWFDEPNVTRRRNGVTVYFGKTCAGIASWPRGRVQGVKPVSVTMALPLSDRMNWTKFLVRADSRALFE